MPTWIKIDFSFKLRFECQIPEKNKQYYQQINLVLFRKSKLAYQLQNNKYDIYDSIF